MLKKSASIDTWDIPRVSATAAAIVFSNSLRGSRATSSASSISGRARTSTLPFTVSGMFSTTPIAEGTM